MNALGALAIVVTLAAFATAAPAEGLPDLAPDLENVAAVACVRIGHDGNLTGAYLLTSTGDATKDGHLLEWVRKLHWDEAKPGERLRDTWFPMPITIGAAKPVVGPARCAPPTLPKI